MIIISNELGDRKIKVTLKRFTIGGHWKYEKKKCVVTSDKDLAKNIILFTYVNGSLWYLRML